MVSSEHRPPSSADRLKALDAEITAWLVAELSDNTAVVAVERGTPDERRWYVRMHGDDKDVFTVWFTLGQRHLAFETYVAPAPEENAAETFEYVLRRNRELVGLRFAIGDEDAIYLMGEVANHEVSPAELDRTLGSIYQATDHYFLAILRRGFPSRFQD